MNNTYYIKIILVNGSDVWDAIRKIRMGRLFIVGGWDKSTEQSTRELDRVHSVRRERSRSAVYEV